MKRIISETLKENLLSSELWQTKLKQDCINDKVFMAIRKNVIDFYHKGGRLFCFDKKGFKTHIKYATLLKSNGKDYLNEDELKNIELTTDFLSNYSRIKENCSKYSGVESIGVSSIYHKHSYLSNEDIVVLDIEVSFKSLGNGSQDRIDILLFNTKTRELKFVEAKHFSNSEIWSTKNPKVINQIERYEEQIKEKNDLILSEYTTYIELMNDIFDRSLPTPTSINPKAKLLIFGFDNDQKKGRLKGLILENKYYENIDNYHIGDVNIIKLRVL